MMVVHIKLAAAHSSHVTCSTTSIFARIGKEMESIMDFVEVADADTPVKRKAESDAGKIIEAIMKGKVVPLRCTEPLCCASDIYCVRLPIAVCPTTL